MKWLLSASAFLLIAVQSQIALAKRCPDGKYRAVCPPVARPTSGNRPTILPNPSDYIGHEAEYRADLADFRRQIDRERRDGTISQAQFNAKLSAQIGAQKMLNNTKAH